MLRIKSALHSYYKIVHCSCVNFISSKFSNGLNERLLINAENASITASDQVIDHSKIDAASLAEKKDNQFESETYSIAKLYKNKNWKIWWKAESYGKHPGVCRLPAVALPEQLDASANCFLREFEKEPILDVSQKLNNILLSRRVFKKPHTWLRESKNDRVPVVDHTVLQLARMTSQEYRVEDDKEKHVQFKEKQSSYVWKNIEYDKINAAAFLLGRSPACYASSLHVMNEIKKNVSDFLPYSMLDFGSGTGMSVWAANNLWKDSLKQYYCVDSSIAMNKLAFYLFSGGNYDETLPGLFIRQSLPVSNDDQYDIVISGYSLSELTSEKERLALIKHLWEKTLRFFILIEHGNFYGYFIMMEARNLLLSGLEGADKLKARKWSKFSKPGKIFSPCPHVFDCPKWGSNSACFFSQKYVTPSYYRTLHSNANVSESSTFSYMIFEKRTDSVSLEATWPRVVNNPQYHRDCATCHLCTPMGTIEHVPVTKEHYGKDLLYLAKKSTCGDSIPLTPRKNTT